ncbi:MAG: helix-turn-helix domain-containing protein [Alphaproteobacteria bacterium]
MNAIIRPISETPETVTLSRADYEALLDQIEDAADIALMQAAEARGMTADALSDDALGRLIDGESPVRVWREHRGLTATALAEAAGLSASYLSEIEARRKPGSVKAIAALAKALGVDMEDLTSVE